jgi:hypothetical protein
MAETSNTPQNLGDYYEGYCLIIPEKGFKDAQRLYQETTEALKGWRERRDRAEQRIASLANRPSTPPWWPSQAHQLVRAAFDYGLDACYTGIAISSVPVETPENLRWWCRLQFKLVDIISDAYPVYGCYRREEVIIPPGLDTEAPQKSFRNVPLDEEDVFHLAKPLMPDAILEAD